MEDKVMVYSDMKPKSGQQHRSSENFTLKDRFAHDVDLVFQAFYNYGTPNQREAKGIVFDIKVDKTGHDATYLHKITSGHHAHNTGDRNLYIANPEHADRGFTVEVMKG